MSAKAGANELRTLQRWFAGVVEHPRTADVAIRSRALDAMIPRAEVERGAVIAPNPRLDAAGMLQIYNGAYLARLVEVLEGEFGAVAHVLGHCEFQALVARYLAAFPSRHPNLNRLGREFPAFVRRQRKVPQRAFLAELAELELACSIAFDAAEFEPLTAERLGAVRPEQWATARFVPNPSLQLLTFRHPVDHFYQPWKQDEPVPVPAPERSQVAVFRRDDQVWRQRLTRPMYAVLKALADGTALPDALAKAPPGEPVQQWFQGFAADGLFTDVVFDD
ncbi:MAG: putative DNA-binding domain-containing protein [Planctomycetes bacterium]|nr:putative DNA-binding domain-containing protein [Planctomycetota bacterium]